MSENEGASIDLSVNADAALQTLQELTAAAKEADATLSKLKTDMASQVNQAFGSAMGTTVDYPHAANIVRGLPQADIEAVVPGVPALQQQIAERGAQITGQAMDFTSANPQSAGQPIPTLLTQFQEAQARQAEQSQRQQEAQQARQAQQPASSSVSSVPSGAQPGDPVSNAARYGLAPASTPLSPFGQPGASTDARDAAKQQGALGGTGSGGSSSTDTTQQDRASTQLGERFAQALTRSGVGMVTGGIQGAASAAGMGATGDLVGALARPLMELVSAPLAIGAAVIGGAAGIGLGVNALQSKYAGEQQGLAGSVGTTTGATPSSELTTAQQAGWAMMYHEADSVAAARQLGDMGVQSGQLGAGLTASMALSRIGGIGLDQTTALTGQMMQSGMSGNQVGDYFAQLDQAARQSGVSVARLTEGIVHLNQAAGIGQISVNGLAAAQALTDQTGTKIDIAQAMSGAIGATGTTALSQGALLGLNPTQFEAATQDPAKLLDSYANLAKRYDVGTGGVQVAQQAMSAAGFDFSKMDSHQADVFTRKLVSEGPGAAQKYEDSLTKKENAPGAPGPHNFDELTQASVTVAHNITSATDQFKIGVEQAAAGFVTSISGAADRGTGVAHTVAHARAAHRVNADGTISDSTGMPIVNIPPSLQTVQDRLHGNVTRFGNDGTTYASDGTPQAGTGGVGTHPGLTGNPYGTGLHYAEQQGMSVKNIAGFAQAASPEVVQALDAASKRTGVPVQVLLAQAAQETSNFNTTAISNDGGYGLAQMTDPKAAQQYLSQAAHELHKPVSSDWHQMAFNPAISAQAMADYDKDNFLSKQGAGSWDKALAMYNGGPNGWNITGHPGQGRDYGTGIAQRAEEVQHRLEVVVHVKDGTSGKTVGHTQTTHTVRTAHPAHSIDPTRRHVAAQSYGPQDRTPPAPGIPTLPGHIGGPIRR